MHSLLWMTLLLAGCEKDLVANMDASSDAPAMPDAATVCKPPATDAHPAAMYTVYLNFDGVTLTKADDDAGVNRAQVLINDPSVIPRYMPNDSDSVRQGRIDLIVGYVTRALAPYSIDVVTTRPASGEYEMMVVGGDAVTLGYPAGVLSIAPGTCDAMNRNRVAIEFDAGLNAIHEANAILSDLGACVGLAPTILSCDCMNRTTPCATADSAICTFHDMAMTDPQQPNCGRLPSQDELMLLRDAWGCR